MMTFPLFSSDDFDLSFVDAAAATWECPTCGVIEPVRRELSGKRVAYFKRRCDCVIRQQQERYEAHLRREALDRRIKATFGGLTAGSYVYPYRNRTFSSFDKSRQPKAWTLAQVWAKELKGTFVLYGDYGTGKTHLLAAICNTLIDREVGCFFFKAPDLFDLITSYMDRHWDYQEVLERAVQTPLLVIDDIDKVNPSAWKQERFYSIIDKRADLGLPIAISTNQPDQLDTFVGGACASRLSIGQIAVEMVGADYRKQL